MANATPRPCAKVGCPKTTTEGYCAEHKKVEDKSWSSNAYRTVKREKKATDSVYSTARWQRLRKMMLRRQPACQAEGCNELAREVDHIVPMSNGGAQYDMANLQCLCTSCHARKTLKEYHEAKKTSGSS